MTRFPSVVVTQTLKNDMVPISTRMLTSEEFEEYSVNMGETKSVETGEDEEHEVTAMAISKQNIRFITNNNKYCIGNTGATAYICSN